VASLGEKIYNLRKSKNLSQEEFGEKIGVSRQAVSQWETDSLVPKTDKLRAICSVFGISADYFFDEDAYAPEKEENSNFKKEDSAGNKKRSTFIVTAVLIFLAVAFLAVGIILSAVLAENEGNLTSTITLNFSHPSVIILFICCAVSLAALAVLAIIKNLKKK